MWLQDDSSTTFTYAQHLLISNIMPGLMLWAIVFLALSQGFDIFIGFRKLVSIYYFQSLVISHCLVFLQNAKRALFALGLFGYRLAGVHDAESLLTRTNTFVGLWFSTSFYDLFVEMKAPGSWWQQSHLLVFILRIIFFNFLTSSGIFSLICISCQVILSQNVISRLVLIN